MSWFREEAEKEVMVHEPIAMAVTTNGETQEYLAVAERVGLTDSPIVLGAKLRIILAEEGCSMYDADAVGKYLNAKFTTTAWCWKPLRASDARKVDEYWPNPVRQSDRTFHMDVEGRWVGYAVEDVYTKPVPLPVLLTVEKIASKLPAVTFWVSDDAPMSWPDPFLMVAVHPEYRFVIERWDEPSFRG